FDARFLRGAAEAYRPVEVDRIGRCGVEVTDGIVGEGGEADHGVIPVTVVRLDLSDVEPGAGGDVLGRWAQVAVLVEAYVQPVHDVSGRTEERDQHRADVAAISCDKDFHYLVGAPVTSGDTGASGRVAMVGTTNPSTPKRRNVDGDVRQPCWWIVLSDLHGPHPGRSAL